MLETHYKIENREISLDDIQNFDEYIHSDEVKSIVNEAQRRYLPWQEFKNKSWATDKKENIWSLIKIQRKLESKKTTILDKDNRLFTYNPTGYIEFLHQVDLELGGNFLGIGDFTEGDKQQFIRRNIIEESIASSQLEGANTSRSAAKKMLQEGRTPRNKSEQMIVNNHETMKMIEEELSKQELSIDVIFELHRRITYKTIDDKHIGVLRETLDENENPLVIKPWNKNTIAYVAPPKEFVEKQLEQLILFANDKDGSGFIHPLLKAIMLHFWVGLLHPFEDGNGRLARILFYWYMLKRKYWAFSYLSLSERILKSSKQYSMAFIYSEQDENDLNYFIHYNIDKLKLARKNFQEYVTKKVSENRSISELIKSGYNLNKRQLKLLQYLAKDEQRFTSLTEHCNINKIGKVTASTDLKKLIKQGLLKKIHNGRNVYYYPTHNINELFKL